MELTDDLGIETLLVHLGVDASDTTGAVAPPIHPAAAFVRPALDRPGRFFYSRRGNPTRAALEALLARLHRGKHAFAFGSGMAAVTAVAQLLRAGDRVVLPDDVYGNTHRLYTQVLPAFGVRAEFYDLADLGNLERALQEPAALVWLESPTNPSLKVIDLRGAAEIGHAHGALVAVDNSLASPYFQRPLELGADLVMESTTKYLNGHDDLMGGAVITNDDALAERLRLLQYVGGAVPSPFDCWLLLRGVRTLALRMERHQQNAFAVARFLAGHPKVAAVHYPGLETHPQHELAKRQMAGFSGMVSFEVRGGAAAARRVVEGTRLFKLAGGLGGVESLVSYPAAMSHASQSEAGSHLAVSPALVRLSVGIERADDLIADLERALARA